MSGKRMYALLITWVTLTMFHPVAANNWAVDLLEDFSELVCPVDRNSCFATQEFGRGEWLYPKSEVLSAVTFERDWWRRFTVRSTDDITIVRKYYVDFLKRRGWKIRHIDAKRGRLIAVCRPAKLIMTITQGSGSDAGFCVVAVSLHYKVISRC